MARAAIAEIEADETTIEADLSEVRFSRPSSVVDRAPRFGDRAARQIFRRLHRRALAGLDHSLPLGRFEDAETKIAAFEAKFGQRRQTFAVGRDAPSSKSPTQKATTRSALEHGRLRPEKFPVSVQRRRAIGRLGGGAVQSAARARKRPTTRSRSGLRKRATAQSLGRLGVRRDRATLSIEVARKNSRRTRCDSTRTRPTAFTSSVASRKTSKATAARSAKMFFRAVEPEIFAARGWHIVGRGARAFGAFGEGDTKSAEKYAAFGDRSAAATTCFSGARPARGNAAGIAGKIDGREKDRDARASASAANVRRRIARTSTASWRWFDGQHDRAGAGSCSMRSWRSRMQPSNGRSQTHRSGVGSPNASSGLKVRRGRVGCVTRGGQRIDTLTPVHRRH